VIKSRTGRWAGEMRNEYTILASKPEGKRPWEVQKMDMKETGYENVNWFRLWTSGEFL
jgi:hypothetical protein